MFIAYGNNLPADLETKMIYTLDYWHSFCTNIWRSLLQHLYFISNIWTLGLVFPSQTYSGKIFLVIWQFQFQFQVTTICQRPFSRHIPRVEHLCPKTRL